MPIYLCAALLERVEQVQSEGAKLRSDNETLQTCELERERATVTPARRVERELTACAVRRHRQPDPDKVSWLLFRLCGRANDADCSRSLQCDGRWRWSLNCSHFPAPVSLPYLHVVSTIALPSHIPNQLKPRPRFTFAPLLSRTAGGCPTRPRTAGSRSVHSRSGSTCSRRPVPRAR